MNSNEILNKYINLIDKGYCSDCNELNCIDNFPHAKITHAIRELQQENQELKKMVENYKELGFKYLQDKNNNLKIHYKIKPSFTTRKIKELQQENEKQTEVIDKAIEFIKEKARNNCWIDQYESCDLIKILNGGNSNER